MGEPIRCWVKSPQVLAVQYTGDEGFDLSWLRQGETVGAAVRGPSGACVIEAAGREPVVVQKGDWIIRSVDDPTKLAVCPEGEFAERYIVGGELAHA